MTNYPLGHHPAELTRLDKQAQLLHDSTLDGLIKHANSCLEIGCGHGSNIPLILRANPNIDYTGIDISSEAIHTASTRFRQQSRIEFFEMNAANIRLQRNYDLIFTKLVLWSIPDWRQVLKQVSSLLNPGGTFYALEPCNHLIQFNPPKPLVSSWMTSWDSAARNQGFNSYIGTTIASAMVQAGFENVGNNIFTVNALGCQKTKYMEIIENLKGFYTGVAASNLGIDTSGITEQEVIRELYEYDEQSFVMDALFASWGKRPNRHEKL